MFPRSRAGSRVVAVLFCEVVEPFLEPRAALRLPGADMFRPFQGFRKTDQGHLGRVGLGFVFQPRSSAAANAGSSRPKPPRMTPVERRRLRVAREGGRRTDCNAAGQQSWRLLARRRLYASIHSRAGG